MDWIIKILSLIVFALIGGVLFSVTTNILIMSGLIDVESVTSNFGQQMTQKAVMVWGVSVIAGAGSLFIKSKWRYLVTLMPLYMPTLFVIVYTIAQR